MAAGDVNGDGKVDLVEVAPDEDDVGEGHLSYCPGGSNGPRACEDIPSYPSSALAVGDINGDGYGDVVQGDDSPGDGAGVVRVWLGGESGLSGKPMRITQDTGRLPGDTGAGDEFGHDVAICEVTGDRWGDIVVAARSDEAGGGSVSIVPGSKDGAAPSNAVAVPAPSDLPTGSHFGGAISVLDLDNDGRPELIVGVEGVESLDDALVTYTSQSDGGLGRPEQATGLAAQATLNADSPLTIGR